MINHALRMRPGCEAGRKRVLRIALARALEQLERTRVSLGVHREDVGHGPQRQVVGTEVGIGLAARPIDLRETQAGLQRRHDARGLLLVEAESGPRCGVAPMRPEMPSRLGIEQPERQAQRAAGLT